MKYRNNYFGNLAKKAGIHKIYNLPKHFTPMYVLGEVNGCRITVADMLKQIEYAIRFIKANFDVDQKKYKEALNCLRFFKLKFQNKSSSKPSKEAAHFIVEVFHEIQDLHTQNEIIKKENEQISMALDMLIDMYMVD